MPNLKIVLFGSPRIYLNSTPISTDRRKAIALLTYLVVNRQTYSREALATLLWPEFTASKSFAYLRRTIWEINNALGDGWLSADRDQVSWQNWENTWLDVAIYQGLVSRCLPGEASEQCLTDLEEATQLYQGDFLAGFTLPDAPAFDEWQFFTAEKMRALQSQALETLTIGYTKINEISRAIDYNHRWIAFDPVNEAAHRLMMSLYARSNQRTAALRQYEVIKQLLGTQLGVDPQPETEALYAQIKAGEIAATPVGTLNEASLPLIAGQVQTEHQPKKVDSPPTPVTNLPIPPTPFIGRVNEITEIDQMLAQENCRLLTLLGPGGIGKTRLAIQAAEQQLSRFNDGVHFIPLAALADPESILPAIAKVLRFSFDENAGAARDQLLDYLRVKKLLLVLDNYEHLSNDAGIRLPLDILQNAKDVKILVTSRARLNVQGEYLFTVSGMSIPVSANGNETLDSLQNYSSVGLFLQSARRVSPGFRLTDANRSAIVQICQLLQGMPLGIELAAAWVEMLEPAQILAEMQHSLDFLESNQRDIPERQRSIRAVYDTSMYLLDPFEREVFQKLAVFQAGFTRQSAEFVAGASLRTLTSLVNKSLLHRIQPDRFVIHELLRQYARDQLQVEAHTWETIQNRHCEYFFEYLGQCEHDLRNSRQNAAMTAIDQELENILQAWYWAIQHPQVVELEPALTLLTLYFHLWNFAEMEAFTVRSLEYLEAWPGPSLEKDLLQVKLLTIHAFATFDLLDPGPAQSFQRAWDLVQQGQLEEKLGIWSSMLARAALLRHDPIEANAMARRSLERLQKVGKPWEIALTLRFLASGLLMTREIDESRQLLLQATDIDLEQGDDFGLADDLTELAEHAMSTHSYDVAHQLILRVQQILDKLGSIGNLTWTLEMLGNVSLASGDYAQAVQYYQQARQGYEQRGFTKAVAGGYSWESIAALRLGDIQHARETRLLSLRVSEEFGYQTGFVWSQAEMGEIERVDGNYPQAQRWYREALTYLEKQPVINLCSFAQRGLGQIALAQGELELAEQLLQDSLKSSRDDYFTWGTAYALCCLGQVSTAQGQLDRAKQYYQEAAALLAQWGEQGVAMELAVGIAELFLNTDRPAQAVALTTFTLNYQGTWHETRERASDLLVRAISHLTSTEFSAAQQRGKTTLLDEIQEKLGTGDLDRLCAD